MKKNSYSEFVVKNKEQLKDLAQVPWWRIEQDGTGWMIKGFCATEGNTRYSLLLTNYSRVYFVSAGVSQINREIREYNPMIIGGVAGVLPILQDCIQRFDENTKYLVVKENCAFEVSTLVKGMLQFKWCFILEKLRKNVGKKVIEKFLVFPLINTILAYENSARAWEEQMRKKVELDCCLAERQNFLQFSRNTNEHLSLGLLSAVKVEEDKIVKKVTGFKKEENLVPLKRKPSPPEIEEKRERKIEDYEESTEEVKRKLDIQAKLAKKKGKQKIDFL